MSLNNQPPYWEICKLRPFGDHFQVMYQDFSGLIQVGTIPFTSGTFEWLPGVSWEVKEDDVVTRFLDSLGWCVSFMGDNREHRSQILEFHLANSSIVSDYLRVYWQGDNGEWEHETWEFYKWEGFLEIVSPLALSSGEIKRFDISLTSFPEILEWLLADISSTTKGKDYCLWVDFGNR